MKYKSFEGHKQSPVREGDVRMVKIVDQGKQGDGIARVEGLIIFVKGAKIGEELNVKVTKIIKNSAFAEKVEG